jgi:hypothetical protein
LRPAALPWHCLAHTTWRMPGQDDVLKSCPPSAALAAPGPRGSNRSRGLWPQNGLSPSVQALRIKPGSWVKILGQTKSRHLQSRTGRASGKPRKALAPQEKLRSSSTPFRSIPRDVQKERSPNCCLFHEARKGAPTHRAGTPSHLCRGSRRFCQVESDAWNRNPSLRSNLAEPFPGDGPIDPRRMGRMTHRVSLSSPRHPSNAPLQRHKSRIAKSRSAKWGLTSCN